MDLESFRDYCLAKAGAGESMPFGPDTIVFKVQKKMFALASLEAVPPRVNLKCDPELALELRDRYEEVRPGYHMNKKHWNTIELNGRIPSAEIRQMIDHSYSLVVTQHKKG
jgi:predicted DNA-binding protein (MmcQ/YjbR family)